MNGGFFTYTHHNNKIVAIVGLSCKTDFAERTDVFKECGKDIAQHVACSETEDLNELLAEELVMGEDGETVSDFLVSYEKTLGEKLEIVKFIRFTF